MGVVMNGIVIGVEGESATDPGVSRAFEYPKVDPTPPLVTLSLSYGGATEYAWEIVSQPDDASAVLSSETDPAPTFTPTASVAGSYLLKCTVNDGEVIFTNGLAFLTEHLGLRKPAPGETNQFNATRGWEAALGVVLDEVDALGSAIYDAGGARRRAVIDILDCTLEPPAASEGDRYILDTSGTAHVDYGATAGDIVEYINSAWTANTPSEGWVAYVDEKDVDYRFVDDGTPTWEEVTGAVAIPDFSNQVWIDADNGSDVDGDGTQGSPFATLAAAAASLAAPTTFGEYQAQITFHVGPGVYMDNVTMPYRLVISVIGYGAVIFGVITWNHSTEYLHGVGPGDVSPLLMLSGNTFGDLIVYDVVSKNIDTTRVPITQKAIYVDGVYVQGDFLHKQSGSSTAGNHSGYLKLYLSQCTFNPNIPSIGTQRIGGERESVIEDTNALWLTTENCDLQHVVCGCVYLTDIRHTIFREAFNYSISPINGSGSYPGHIGGISTIMGFGDMGFVDTCVLSGTCVFGNNGVLGGYEYPIKFDAASFANFGAGATYDNLSTDYELTDKAEGVGVDNSGWSGNLSTETSVQAALDTFDAMSVTIPDFENQIWIDADNGSDVTGDGTRALPFATLAAAAASLSPPADFAGFSVPVTFHVGPGVYSAAVTLPYRQQITVVGYGAIITGDLNWNYKDEYIFAQSKWSTVLSLILQGSVKGSLILYNIKTKNADNTQEFLPLRYMFVKDCMLNGSIQNLQSGGASATYVTGNLNLLVDGCLSQPSGSAYIGGERETTDPADTANTIVLQVTDSTIIQKVCGCVAFYECFHTLFAGGIDWSVSPINGSGSYAGNIGGSSGAVYSLGSCTFDGTKKFGWDNATGGSPTQLKIDTFSFSDLGTHTLDNVTESLHDQAAGLAVNNSGWGGNLGSEGDVQAALDTIDGLSLNPTIYDDTTTFTDVAATGGSSTVQLDVGAIDDGIVEAVKLSITAGTSDDTTIQLYDGNPATGNLIYEAPNLDLVTQALDDRNCWYAEFVTQGDLWAKITNDGASISSYSLRLRVKGDA